MTNLMRLLMQISLIASVMILVVMVMRALLAKRMNPVVVMVLWAIVLVRLCLPIMLESPVNVGSIIPDSVTQVSDGSTNAVVIQEMPEISMLKDTSSVQKPYVHDETIRQPERYGTTQEQPQATYSWSLSNFMDRVPWWSILTGVWALGAAIVLGATARHYIKFKRRLRNCVQTADDTIIRIVNQYKQELRVNRKVTVIECSDIKTPAVFGYYNPVILLPVEFATNMDDYAVRCILLHEMCHIKRCDVLKSYVWLAAKALHWFNPLVWIAYKMFKDDTELCCDQMVLRKLNGKRKYEYTQSLIDVFRMSKQTEALSLTISLFETKTKLVERVMRMLKPERKSKTAAWVSFMLAAVMIITSFTTACTLVAEEDVVKDDIALVDTQNQDADEKETEDLQQTPEQNDQLEDVQSEEIIIEEKEPLAKYSVTGKWTDTMEREDSIIKLNIDADIVMPDVDTYNTYYVNTAGITQEMSDKILELLFGDSPLYEYQERTKASYQKEIDQLEISYQSMLDGTFDFMYYSNKENAIEDAKEYIERRKRLMEDAPETVEQVPMNTILTCTESGEAFIRGVADLGKEEEAGIIIDNMEFGSNMHFWYAGHYMYLQDKPLQAPIGNLSITKDEAIKRATAFFKEIGLNDFQLHNHYVGERFVTFIQRTEQYAHVLEFTRVVDGIEVSQNAHIPLLDSMNCNMERMIITIDDGGILKINWEYGFRLGKASQDQELLPIEDIEAIIMDKMYIHEPMLLRMSDEDMDIPGFEIKECTYNIDQIRLEYMKLPYNNDFEDIRLIPVWSVYASEDWRFTKKENGESVEDVRNKDDSYVHLTINALDGSMVDKELWANRKFY